MTGGRLFQTRGSATANALSPSDVVVRGVSSIMLAADREPGRPRPARRKSSARCAAVEEQRREIQAPLTEQN